MTAQRTEIRDQERQGIRAQVAMTVLTAVALGGLVLWQVRQGGGDATAPATSATTQSAQHDAAVPMGGVAERLQEASRQPATREAAEAVARGGMAELYAERAAAARAADDTVYVVGSQAEAELLVAQLDRGSAVVDAQGLPVSPIRVEWADSAEAESRLLTAVTELNTLRGHLGSPPVKVIDLRAAGAGVTGPTVAGMCGVIVAPTDC